MATKTAAKAPITSALNDSDRDVTGKALQGTLLDLIDLHLVAKQAHWNVVGKFFRDVHLQLDELIDTARAFADDVAERASAIGVSPDGRSSTVASGSGMPKFDAGWKNDREVIEYIVSALSELISRVRMRIDETDKTDLVTQDLLLSIASELEKSHWMWQAQLA
ncbi:starvation-inducible DNA-binding protein [Saccharopolyspora erythraea NRRL 2338]|uniref:Starvation-response DNA binding protein n=2 Tax=Saccharopolyspora erythraea TaxID=1836 RepID=A4F6G2_SACEN|nr:DNA starvation/stationary phase protection protein [Saccharopolyspora erythraea]EQD88091.1 ferritin [Saccharopolyspora erythraea D]PFG93439.1 starvation-inducible DNA-binding protein [Saccharopolyspora erythraea NRRL 2338]QRK90312.1 DNA starvation/stationary phase protection protein [Saccharopolyspora erythraea]CAL99636.1 starvation-response DNA binding protein [Saccharopolyspora erythraea NRRL 2338]